MAPSKRKAVATTTRATRAKPAAAASSDTVGIPELFKKVKADLVPDAVKPKQQTKETVVLEPASAARKKARAADTIDAAVPDVPVVPLVPLVESAAPSQVPLTTEEDELLRAFDLSIAFGPSLGLTRKERWLRAEGARPPARHPPTLQCCSPQTHLRLPPPPLAGCGLEPSAQVWAVLSRVAPGTKDASSAARSNAPETPRGPPAVLSAATWPREERLLSGLRPGACPHSPIRLALAIQTASSPGTTSSRLLRSHAVFEWGAR